MKKIILILMLFGFIAFLSIPITIKSAEEEPPITNSENQKSENEIILTNEELEQLIKEAINKYNDGTIDSKYVLDLIQSIIIAILVAFFGSGGFYWIVSLANRKKNNALQANIERINTSTINLTEETKNVILFYEKEYQRQKEEIDRLSILAKDIIKSSNERDEKIQKIAKKQKVINNEEKST